MTESQLNLRVRKNKLKFFTGCADGDQMFKLGLTIIDNYCQSQKIFKTCHADGTVTTVIVKLTGICVETNMTIPCLNYNQNVHKYNII